MFKAGAGVAPLITFLTSWSVFAMHRFFAFELPLMGLNFAMVRLLSSVILPLIAGVSTLIFEDLFLGSGF
jgi:hypothetical protein